MAKDKIERNRPFVVPAGTFSSTEVSQSFYIGYYYPDYILCGLVINGEQRYITPFISEMSLTPTSLYIKRANVGYWPGTSFSAVLMKAN